MENKRLYEMMVLTDPNVDESKINMVFDRLKDLGAKSGAEFVSLENWGKKKLAYEIKDLREGVYYLINLNSDPAAIAKLEAFLRIQNPVLRFLVIRRDDLLKAKKEKVA
ncbi:MAG: 30S ribosomal protein S6 [Candidatus Cloacimonadota bacterium]|nr:MAG: 30S ribosomal protein S6 [Candidatus Cloacimonadota bacterium]